MDYQRDYRGKLQGLIPEGCQPRRGGGVLAQHTAEGGVLGKVGKESRSPGDGRVLTHTLQEAATLPGFTFSVSHPFAKSGRKDGAPGGLRGAQHAPVFSGPTADAVLASAGVTWRVMGASKPCVGVHNGP